MNVIFLQDIRKDKTDMLQKSNSQQHIPNKFTQSSLSSSKSVSALTKSEDSEMREVSRHCYLYMWLSNL